MNDLVIISYVYRTTGTILMREAAEQQNKCVSVKYLRRIYTKYRR